ncbi:helix-turn-helix domain-containing protein [Hymenobacter lucidus]|uniref:Helix-turn-helix domain-containing protein n=1 Tax=Hymenobacter lucidus TaxID=2880930 RepID=A0ABS8AW30_9BACT|nr:helix-turn-helix transcriptional regulator [Hymenobacter lucidus]MCB2409371.1 helix-turn-helix domain-containing protein [Hymenobacter lucidus]
MIDATSPLLLSLTAAVRAHFGLSLPQLARYLGVSTGFISHVEAGRKGLPPALAPRLLQLSRLLPPPLGQGLPAAPAPDSAAHYDPLAPLPSPDALLAPIMSALAAAPETLRSRLRDVRLRLLTQGQRLAQLQRSADALAHRRRGLAQLQASPAPTEPAETARYARWLGELATDLARDEPDPAATTAARLLLAARVAGLRAEAASLTGISPAA